MKKLTKLTALVLALALVLGMASLAAPAEVTKTVDFTGYANIDAFKAAANVVSYSDGSATVDYFKDKSPFTFGEGSFAYDKIYYQTASTNPNWAYLEMVDIAGVKAVAPNAAMWHNGGQLPLQVGFTLPEAWTLEKDTALVVEMGVIFAERNKTGADNYHYQTIAKPYYSALLTETSEDADSNIIRPLAGLGMNNERGYLLRLAQNASENNQSGVGDMPNEKVNKIITVIRPFESDDEAEPASLQLYIGANKMEQSLTSGYHIAGYTPIKAVHGFQYGFMNHEMFGYTGYRLYEVSLNPADFSITSAKNFTDLDITDEIKVTFSQPVTAKVGTSTLADTLTITPEGGEALVYGEDYTFSFAEKANGTAIYDEMTITPIKPWVYGTNYVVGIPDGFQNIARVALADTDAESANADTITFATVAAPTFDVTLKAYKGLSDNGEELSALTAGTTYFKVTAAYNNGKVVANGNVKIEILDADGNVVKSATTARTLTEATTFGAAFKLEAGQSARASLEGGVLGNAEIGAAQ